MSCVRPAPVGRLFVLGGSALAFLLCTPSPGHAQAGEAPRQAAADERASPYDRIWRFAEWYENDTGAVVQRVLFSGRFQYEYAGISAEQGELHEWNVRRMRLGQKLTLFRAWTLHGEVELNPQEADPLYVRLTDMYLQWARGGRWVVTVGKQGVPFTVDGATSSKELLTVDRSNLANNIWFPQEYMAGVSVSGRRALWTYRAGAYSAGEANREFGEFNGGIFALGVLGYDFAGSLGVREALLAGNYVYQQPDPGNTFTRPLEHILSVNFRLDAGRWGLRTDVSAASGYLGQSDLWGATAMPFICVTDKLQVVVRYTFLESEEPHGIRLATYENRLVPGRGDSYRELYLGVNYFIDGHRLKIQTGVHVADMNDRENAGGVYTGTAWTTGLRVGW